MAVLCLVALQLQLGYGELNQILNSIAYLHYIQPCLDFIASFTLRYCTSHKFNTYLLLQSVVHSSASELAVTIDVSYSKPADFSMDPPNYRAGTSITLTCRVEGVTEGLTYSWSSTCAHNCFVRGRTTQNVTRHGLRSVDSGTHMCNATDALGRKGTATIVMNVIGKVNCCSCI